MTFHGGSVTVTNDTFQGGSWSITTNPADRFASYYFSTDASGTWTPLEPAAELVECMFCHEEQEKDVCDPCSDIWKEIRTLVVQKRLEELVGMLGD